MEKTIDKLKELKLSERNAKAVYRIIRNYSNPKDIPGRLTGSSSFEQLFFPPFREMLKKEYVEEKVLEQIADESLGISCESVKKYLFDCGTTYIPSIIKWEIHQLNINQLEYLRRKTQKIILKEIKEYCNIENETKCY